MRNGSEAGFTLVGLLIAVLAVNLALAVAMTSWVEVDRRADEAELIWRGNQYVRAIECYRVASGGTLPTTLEELLDEGCIRKLYPDPITRGGEWRVLRVSDLTALQAAAAGGTATAGTTAPGATPTGGVPATGATAGLGSAPASLETPGGLDSGSRSLETPGSIGQGRSLLAARMEQLRASRGSRLGGLGPGDASQGIIGVASTSNREGLRTVRDPSKKRYGDWWFTVESR